MEYCLNTLLRTYRTVLEERTGRMRQTAGGMMQERLAIFARGQAAQLDMIVSDLREMERTGQLPRRKKELLAETD